MLIWNPSKLTTKGKALLAKAQAGRCTIKITRRRPDPPVQLRRGNRHQNVTQGTGADTANPQQRDPERKYTRSEGSDHK